MILTRLLFWLSFTGFVIAPLTTSNAAHHHQAGVKAPAISAPDAHPGPAQHAPTSHWSAPAAEKAKPNPVAMSSGGLKEAGKLYRDNCAACHGQEGLGDGPVAQNLGSKPANILAMAESHADGDLHWKIATGRGEMPGWGDVLSDEQIWMLVHYMKTLPAFFVANRSEEQ